MCPKYVRKYIFNTILSLIVHLLCKFTLSYFRAQLHWSKLHRSWHFRCTITISTLDVWCLWDAFGPPTLHIIQISMSVWQCTHCWIPFCIYSQKGIGTFYNLMMMLLHIKKIYLNLLPTNADSLTHYWMFQSARWKVYDLFPSVNLEVFLSSYDQALSAFEE